MPVVPKNLYYYVGEKPPPLPCRYQDDAGDLITSISGTTLVAKCKLGSGGTPFDVSCTNNDDGTFTIDWPTGTSAFAAKGSLKIDIEVTDTPRLWYMNRFSIEIKDRSES